MNLYVLVFCWAVLLGPRGHHILRSRPQHLQSFFAALRAKFVLNQSRGTLKKKNNKLIGLRQNFNHQKYYFESDEKNHECVLARSTGKSSINWSCLSCTAQVSCPFSLIFGLRRIKAIAK